MDEGKPRYVQAKKILEALGIYVPGRHGAARSKYVIIRKFLRFFGLYPNMRLMHFYFEHGNSFIAPKVYEYTHMLNGVSLNKEDVVLDVGCGDGTLSCAIAKSVKKVIGVDTYESAIANAEFKAKELSTMIDAEFHCSKLERLGFEHNSFDKVFSFSVIEHIPNYMEVFEEIFQLLKKDGELIISVDSFSQVDKETLKIHTEKFDVQKYFQKSELYDLLKNLGFKEVSVEPIFKSKFAEKWFIRVMKDPQEYFGGFKRFYSFLLYYIIAYHERKVKQRDHGIFLIAKCKK